MALSAGAVYATLGGKFDRAGFDQFGSSMYRAQAQMEAGEKRMTASAARTSESLHKIGTAAKVAATGGVVALGAAIAGSVKVAADFDKAMRNVNSIAGLNEKQFRTLSKSVLELSGKTAQAPKTLAEGMYQLVSSGFKAHESLQILKASAVAASAGLTTTEVATTAVAAALNAYHLPASKAQAVSDILFQTVNRGVITFDELASTIGLALPFANSLHIGLNQVGASISTLTKEGIPAAQATTYLKNAMVAFLKPSKDLQGAIKQTGAANGEALVKSKGFQGALEAVAKTTDGTKGALQKLFPDIRASAAVFALTGSNAKTAEGDVKAFNNTAGSTSKVFAEQSKSAAFQWQKFKAQLQATGVVIGTAVLPVLTSAVTTVGNWVSSFARSGDAANFGHAVADGFKEAGQVLSDVWGIGKNVLGVLQSIAGALDLGNATNLEAILAAIAGFKIAGVVAPLVFSLASGLSKLATMAAAGYGIGEAATEIGLLANPVGLAAVAVGGLAAALVLLGGHESIETQLANQNAQAHKEQAAAIKKVGDAERAAADKGLAAKQAALDLRDAKQNLADVTKKYGKHSEEYQRALLDEQRAALGATGAQADYQKSISGQHAANTDRITKATKELAKAQKELANIKPADTTLPGGKGVGLSPLSIRDSNYSKDLATAQANLTKRTQEYVQALARANTSDLSRQRLMTAGSQITEKNAQGVSLLIQSLQGIPKSVQSKLLVDNQDALSKAGKLSYQLVQLGQHHTVAQILTTAPSASAAVEAFKAVLAGVPPRKVLQIIHNAGSATAAVHGLAQAIAALPSSKTVTLTTIKRELTQTGSAPTGHGGRVPGAAAGGRTTGPQMYLVGEGSDPVEWIIPRDRKYRGRALGLLQDAMASLLPGAKAGAKHGGTIKESTYLKLSPDQFKAERDRLDQRLGKLKQGETQKDKKGHLTPTAVKDKAAIPGLEQQIKRATAVFHKANDYSNRIQARLDDAQIAQTNMGRFDAISQQVGKGGKPTPAAKAAEKQYLAAVKERLKYLTEARAALQVAVGFAKPGSKWGRDVRQNLATVLADITDLHGATSTGAKDAAAAAAAPTTAYTQAEQDRLDKINADIALAALTDTPTDDVTAAKSLVGFLGGVLTEAQASPAAHGGNAGIAEVAGALKTARDNLASLTASPDQAASGTLDNSQDLQAQLDQARAATAAAQLGQRNSDALLQVFAGPGDIGTGGPNARATVQQNIYTLHPGDPKTLRAIGDAAVAGIGYQPLRQSPRETLGI